MRVFVCVFLLFPGPKSGRLPPARANLLGTSATRPGTCHEPLGAAAEVRWRPEISIFEDQRQHLAPGSCLPVVLTWDEYSRFPDFRPNRESGIPGFPILAESGIGNPGRFPAKSGMGGTGIGDFRVCGPTPE